jgi:hypothetical protein
MRRPFAAVESAAARLALTLFFVGRDWHRL